MKRILLYFLFAGFFLSDIQAQQLPQYSQYTFNEYAINPAVAGSKDYYEVRSNHRYQWVGITDAPRTFTLSAYGPTKNRKMGLGGYLFTDIVGPTRRTGMQLSYSYHLKLGDNWKLGMGLSAGLLQFQIDASKIVFEDEENELVDKKLYSELTPDAKFALYLYSDNFYFGAVAPQLLQNKLNMFEMTSSVSRLEDHYLAMMGYTFEIGEKWKVDPSVLGKYVSPTPPKIDGTLRITYNDAVWVGGSYRTNDAIALMAGFNYKDNLLIGYAHDLTTTNVKNYSSGTHEVMLGLRFHGKDKDPDNQSILK